MGLFTKKIGPVFLKETSDSTEFIEKMQILLEKASGEAKKKIEKQLKLTKYGAAGESDIAFELKHSGMDMYILHDLYFEIDEFAAQIDYLVITRKRIYVIECKNMIGNIEIDSSGAFVRSYELFGKHIKEGIYSPITQNQRHLQVLKKIRKESKNNFFTKMLFEKSFEELYKSVVVLANSKTYLNAKYAKKEIKDQVIRADQLISYLKKKDEEVKDYSMNADEMLDLAQFYLKNDQPERSDYARKYEELVLEADGVKEPEIITEELETSANTDAVEGKEEVSEQGITFPEALAIRLKEFRLTQSRSEGIKPYYIFSDAQMNDLIEKNPMNREDLLTVPGFGNVKVEKYGEEILKILEEARK